MRRESAEPSVVRFRRETSPATRGYRSTYRYARDLYRHADRIGNVVGASAVVVGTVAGALSYVAGFPVVLWVGVTFALGWSVAGVAVGTRFAAWLAERPWTGR